LFTVVVVYTLYTPVVVRVVVAFVGGFVTFALRYVVVTVVYVVVVDVVGCWLHRLRYTRWLVVTFTVVCYVYGYVHVTLRLVVWLVTLTVYGYVVTLVTTRFVVVCTLFCLHTVTFWIYTRC